MPPYTTRQTDVFLDALVSAINEHGALTDFRLESLIHRSLGRRYPIEEVVGYVNARIRDGTLKPVQEEGYPLCYTL
ncbi:MAG: hypothetical protein HYY37_01390 [Candidatus Aenigmarchaeota archaeon]|nr:hypothetical protein [Candidatus Aenigmarchaeota archaeon]